MNWDKITHRTFVLLDKYNEFINIVKGLWITKFILSAVSIAAGYFFVYDLFIRYIPKPLLVSFFSLALLVALEAINFYLPMKYFKFQLNPPDLLKEHNYFSVKKIKRFLFFSSLIGFSISFYTSSQGAATFASRNEDASKDIAAWFESAKRSVNAKYDELINELKVEKQRIESNPTRYRAGGREPTLLDKSQLERIAQINEQIIELERQRKQDLDQLGEQYKDKLKVNQAQMHKSGIEYFVFAGVLILLLNIVNYFIVYLSKVIKLNLVENEEELKLQKYTKRLKTVAMDMAENDINHTIAQFSAVALQRQKKQQTQTSELISEHQKNSVNVPERPAQTVKDVHNTDEDVYKRFPEHEKLKEVITEIEQNVSPEIFQFAENNANIEVKDYEEYLEFFRKTGNSAAVDLLQRYPEATKLLIERERSKKGKHYTISIQDIEKNTEVGKSTLYKIRTTLGFKGR